jgi:hypothetical protein
MTFLVSVGTAAAALPEPATFTADIEAGRVDLESFDFASTGFWDAPPEKRWPWFAEIQSRIDLNPGAHGGCDVKSQRRFAVATWFMLVPTSQSAQEWQTAVVALRTRIAGVDQAIASAARAAAEPHTRRPLLAELHRRFARDQKVREVWTEPVPEQFPPTAKLAWPSVLGTRWAAIDCDNTRWLKDQMAKIGWFDARKFGADADNAAWHLVQHADREPEFQREALAMLRNLPKEATSQSRVAYLVDRVERAAGRPQIYGTQWSCTPDGDAILQETVEPDRLDERRQSVGLAPVDPGPRVSAPDCRQPVK